ncbi:uncharacterized protein LAJ45_08316 [Morchella importuna]|uniref:uncharacterized protein n=1 Tax=Morchella importuna TaxID=1174673 RepID=UPI001E8E09EC|nr:uncharacterized protein LAJ45_08316 [Morchella importuna]KAH8147489.1 hypothetical protein LAJ45_08316 [Morchella importuna]
MFWWQVGGEFDCIVCLERLDRASECSILIRGSELPTCTYATALSTYISHDSPHDKLSPQVRAYASLPTYQIPSDQISASLPAPLHLYTPSTSVTPGPPLRAAIEVSPQSQTLRNNSEPNRTCALALELPEEGRMLLLLRLKLLAPHTPSINWSLGARSSSRTSLSGVTEQPPFLRVQGPVWIVQVGKRPERSQTDADDRPPPTTTTTTAAI